MSQLAKEKAKVLVKEKIADKGVELLRGLFDVDVELEMDDAELAEKICDYDAIVIRSATKLDSGLIERAERLKVIGRAGIGVDNVDVKAATKRGIIVANAPESNIIAAAEHTMALLLAQCRNIPQAHSSLSSGKWERSKFGGVEVYEKTLGILGFGRIGQLVAERARSFGMNVIAYDPYVSAERYRELGVARADSAGDLYARADLITLHLPKTEETVSYLDDDAFSKMRDGVRIVNAARGELIDHDALKRAIDSGKIAGASLDVFPSEPCTDLDIFGYDNVVVTPHLGASTVEAQDRAGVITAQQVVAALRGELVTNAVNIPKVRSEDMEVLKPFINLSSQLGRMATSLVGSPSIDQIEVEFCGHISEYDTSLLTVSVLNGAFQGRVEENVNLVNASSIAEERGIRVTEKKDREAEDFTNVILVRIGSNGESVSVGGTTFGPRHLPHLVYVYGQSFNMELADHMAFFRYIDQPGMIGRVGTVFGDNGINIGSTAVGREQDEELAAAEGEERLAVMVVTVDSPIPQQVMDEILALEGFREGHYVTLQGLSS